MAVDASRPRPAKIVLFLALAALGVLVYLFLLSALRGKLGNFSAAVPAMVLAFLTLILNWRFLRSDGRSLADIGFNAARMRIREMALGFVGGAFTAAAWAVALWCVASVSWRAAPSFDPASAGGSFTFIFFNNAGEELVYRGYLFLVTARWYGRSVAIVGTSILFALLHIQSGVPWQSAVAGVLTSGLLFAVLFARWQSVPLVLAFHAATNVIQEVLGLRSSGLTVVVPHTTGLTARPSYGVLALVALINLSVALGVWLSMRNRRRIVPPSGHSTALHRPMKVWEAVSAFDRTSPGLTFSVVSREPWCGEYLPLFTPLGTPIHEREILDRFLPVALTRETAALSKISLCLESNPEWGNKYLLGASRGGSGLGSRVDEISAVDVHDRFGGAVIEEVLEKGSAWVTDAGGVTSESRWASVVAGAHVMMEQVQKETYAKWGLDFGIQYEWNIDNAEMIFSRNGKAFVRTDLIYVGSISRQTNTFLWGWANESIPANATARLHEVRSYGEEQGFAKLTTAEWQPAGNDGHDVMLVSASVLGTPAFFHGHAGELSLFFLLDNFETAGPDVPGWPRE
jgi:membrane protease YdiL (CAAX protease family)